MEPQIRYVRSHDGTKIATASLGSGPALVQVSSSIGHITSYFEVPEVRAQIERLAERYRVVTYDPRGRGLSDREVTDWSLETRVSDLRAVFEGLSLANVNVLTRGFGSMLGIALAAESPHFVRRLALSPAFARGRDAAFLPTGAMVAPVIDEDWSLYCQITALQIFGWCESGRIAAELMKSAFSPASWRLNFSAARRDDVSSLVEMVRCPTLIMHPQTHQTISAAGISDLAPKFSDARVRTIKPQDSFFTTLADDDITALIEFFAEDTQTAEPSAGPAGTAIVMFADIVDSTALTERMGDAAFRAKARALDVELRRIIRDAGGSVIDAKTLGDGVLATFSSASQGVAAARACGAAGSHAGLPLHLGLHAGDVIREQGNVFGGAVNIAARISALSAAGEVLVSATVRELARTSAGVEFEDRGEQEMKGVGEPVRVYAVRAPGGA